MIDLICEFLAFWAGGTHRQELAGITGLQPRRLSTLLRNGSARRGKRTFGYDNKSKRFAALPHDPNDLAGIDLNGIKSPDEVIATLLAVDAWSRRGAWSTDKKPPFPCPVASTSRYRKQSEPDVFRTLLAGCIRQREVDIVYTARTREITTKFSPHTVVQTAQRVHFRGYSAFDPAENGHYWDLVPSRVSWAQLGGTTGYIDGAGDTEWKEQSVLQLTLCPDIPPQMRAAIRREHGMESDILRIGPLPKALVQYVGAEYHPSPIRGLRAWGLAPE